VSPTLTRRDRVALGSAQGGALYYGPNRRWPEHAPGIFQPLGTLHPGSTQRPPTDTDAHHISGFIVSDIDGTPKLYTGYGSALRNLAPIHLWAMKLDGTWDPAPAHTMDTFGMSTGYQYIEGKLWCHGDQGPIDFATGSPGGTWVDGACAPERIPGPSDREGGFVHPHGIARHDGYTWVAGQKRVYGNTGAVWRGTTPTGSDGEWVWGDPLGLEAYQPNNIFSYQGKLWISPSPDFPGIPPNIPPLPAFQQGRVCYWDEPTHTFLPINNVAFQYANKVVPWKTVMLVADGPKLMSFNGTSATAVLTFPGGAYALTINDICVTADDTVWLLANDQSTLGAFYSSTDLVTWTFRMKTTVDHTGTFTVYGDYVYIGDKQDQVWRTKVTP